MTYPSSDVNTANANAGTDSPATFRTDVLDFIQKFNLLRNHISTFMQGLLTSTSAAAARTSLGAAASGANADITSLGAINSINGGQLGGLRNRIINGGMQVAQRGTSGTVASAITLDRWYVQSNGPAPTWSQQANVNTGLSGGASVSAMLFGGVASQAGFFIRQCIESVNCRDMAGQTVAVSFWAYQDTGSTMSGISTILDYANSTDNFASVTSASGATPSFSIPTYTWTKCSGTIAVSSLATMGLQLTIGHGNTLGPLLVGKSLYITNVQLELGSVATPFEVRPYGLELALCQRYYLAISGIGGSGYQLAAATVGTQIIFPVTMRAIPIMTFVSAGTTVNINTGKGTFFGTTPIGTLGGYNTTATNNASFVGATATASAEL